MRNFKIYPELKKFRPGDRLVGISRDGGDYKILVCTRNYKTEVWFDVLEDNGDAEYQQLLLSPDTSRTLDTHCESVFCDLLSDNYHKWRRIPKSE